MKLLAGIVPFTGDVTMDGVSIRKHPTAYRQLVHYAEAEPVYPPYVTGTDLLYFHQKTRHANNTQLQSLIDTFRIREYMDKPVGTYSSGMLKRLSLAIAFLGQPAVILLDEPLVTLDAQSQGIVLQCITEAVQRQQLIIFTSHQAPDKHVLPTCPILSIQNKTVCFA